MQPFVIRIIEPLTGDVLSPEDVANMKLPFDEGWDIWALYQGKDLILVDHRYDMVADVCRGANAMSVQQLAA